MNSVREIWPPLAPLRSEGRGGLLIDGHVSEVLDLADRAAIMEKGRVVWEGLADSPEVRRAHLGVG